MPRPAILASSVADLAHAAAARRRSGSSEHAQAVIVIVFGSDDFAPLSPSRRGISVYIFPTALPPTPFASLAMEEAERSTMGESAKADHFCVLVHGLWGNPGHLEYLRSSLEAKYDDKLQVLVAAKNSDNFTYDGIEVGGERLAQEVEDELERLSKDGYQVKKFSMIGYSLGGLIARYCCGLLYARGVFDKIEPINFTTFASPHLGVRTPLRGYHSSAWNFLGSRTLSASGRQLFLIDSFRDQGRPLLSVLADPSSIFIKGLSCFKNRVLYANIQNDRSAPYYTTAISKINQFEILANVKFEYLKDYPALLDPNVSIAPYKKELTIYSSLLEGGSSFITQIPLYAAFTVLIPVGTLFFLVNSGIQEFRSLQRIKLHEAGKAGVGLQNYRIPLRVESARQAVAGTFQSANADQKQEYLSDESDSGDSSRCTPSGSNTSKDKQDEKSEGNSLLRQSKADSGFPILALSPEQFEMIESLDRVGFKKNLVHIKLVRHSHAAIIVRSKRKGFAEGKIVVKHWLDKEFEL